MTKDISENSNIRDQIYRSKIYETYIGPDFTKTIAICQSQLKARAPYFNKIIKKVFPENKTAFISDLACGHGAFIHYIKKAGFINVQGVDCSPQQVCLAKQLKIENVMQGNVFEYLQNLSNSSQDIVITFDFIEHLKKNEIAHLLVEIKRVLKTNGKWINHTVNAESPFGGRILYSDFTHEIAFTATSLSQLCHSFGFKNVVSFEDIPVIHGTVSFFRFVFWKIIRMVLKLYIAAETGNTNNQIILTQNFLTVITK